ncbi:MAG: hypothetical protein WC955_00490 [Elusimicrobiota bacterium]
MKKVMAVLAVMILGFTGVAYAGITDDVQTATNDIKTDFSSVSSWFGSQLKPGLEFNASGGMYLPANVCHLLGFEIGAIAGLNTFNIDLSAFKNLAMNAFDANKYALPEMLALPQVMVHAKVGLPFDLDLGAKYGTSEISIDVTGTKFAFKNQAMGAEVRKKIIGGGLEGIILPDISIGVGMDMLTGSLTAGQAYNVTNTDTYSGYNYTQTVNAATTLSSDWAITSMNAKLMVSKYLLFVTPFAGAAAYYNTSKVNTKVNTNGSITLTEYTSASTSSSSAFTIEGPGNLESTGMDIGYFGGLEFSILVVKINVSGEYRMGETRNKDRYCVNAGLRLEF